MAVLREATIELLRKIGTAKREQVKEKEKKKCVLASEI
jgi:hypothetical protein